MAKVVALRTAEPDLRVIVERLAKVEAELVEVRAQLPARPIVLSDNWITVKAAAFDFGIPAKTVSRWALSGLIESVKLNGKRAINRVDLERHLALRH